MSTPEDIAVRPGWRFWLLVLLVAPGAIDVGFLWLLADGWVPAISFAGLLACAALLLVGERARRRMAPESNVAWGAIGILVSGLMAGAWIIAGFVVVIGFSCGGDCVS